uniref:Nucleotide-diphospho-sugar transferase domain-containing protein n=1 Tax=Nicotiana tabacum TaxID=4097 RepID=A0A1S4DNP3_TOBAC
ASLDYENIEQYLELICSKEGQPKSKKQSKLKQVLEEAAMEDKTVIITTLNAAWTAPNSIFDLFLESFRIGNNTNSLLNHVLVVALDQTAYSRCLEVHPNCYALITNGVDFSEEAHFMSDDYLKMMWRRIDFLRIVLQMGYNFIFTDADILWFRRPFAHFYSHADFQIACDHYVHNSFNLKNAPNGGFKYVKSNNQTIQFYKFWYDSRNIYPEKHDQDVLNIIKFHPFLKKIKLKIMFLDTAYFGGFCEPSKDVNLACTMHANCCVGLGNKIHDLKMAINDWKTYMALPNGERISKRHTWTFGGFCETSRDLNLVCTMHANCCIGPGNKIHDIKMALDDWKNYMALTNISVSRSRVGPRIREGLECEAEGLAFAFPREAPRSNSWSQEASHSRESRLIHDSGAAEASHSRGCRRVRLREIFGQPKEVAFDLAFARSEFAMANISVSHLRATHRKCEKCEGLFICDGSFASVGFAFATLRRRGRKCDIYSWILVLARADLEVSYWIDRPETQDRSAGVRRPCLQTSHLRGLARKCEELIAFSSSWVGVNFVFAKCWSHLRSSQVAFANGVGEHFAFAKDFSQLQGSQLRTPGRIYDICSWAKIKAELVLEAEAGAEISPELEQQHE